MPSNQYQATGKIIATTWDNVPLNMCGPWRLWSACTATQSDPSELGTLWVAKEQWLLQVKSELWSDCVDAQADLGLYWAQGIFSHIMSQILSDQQNFEYLFTEIQQN